MHNFSQFRKNFFYFFKKNFQNSLSGGYFVIKGAEKVVLIQEQACQNRILVAKDKTGSFACSVQSSSDESKTQTNLLQKKNKIYLKQNKLKDPVNVVIIFKALGIERDQEIAELVACEETTLSKSNILTTNKVGSV